jgi:phosphate transport system substrate-binding protein
MISALAIAAATIIPTAAVSDQVQLKSSDGTVNLTGDFVDFQDDHYIIRTALGDLRISAARVRCEGEACPTFEVESADLVIKGSDTVGLGLMPLLVSGYASFLDAEASIKATDREGEILAELVGDGGFGDEMGSILVTSSTSGDAFTTLMDQSAHIGMSARRIKPQEARDLKETGAGNMVSPGQEHIVAVDSLVIITHPSNPIQQVSVDQLRDIYAGTITNWNELGGEDAPIKVVNRQEGSGTRSVFDTGVFGEAGPVAAADQVIVDDNNTMASMVNEDPNAIGYVGYAFQRGAKALSLVNECGMLTEPDAFSAKVEEYALQRRLYLYNRGDAPNDDANKFVDFALSDDADGVIAKAGFIDLSVKRKSQDMTGSRARALLDPNVDAYEGGVMREMLGEMVNYDRLSTTFRFRTGSSKLDERGRIDMARLTEFLEGQAEGTKVLFVGFTDNVGAFDSNRSLSVNRAQQVIDELAAFAGDSITGIEIAAAGYGEVAPSACNITENGRAVNRRVEVWIEAAQRG